MIPVLLFPFSLAQLCLNFETRLCLNLTLTFPQSYLEFAGCKGTTCSILPLFSMRETLDDADLMQSRPPVQLMTLTSPLPSSSFESERLGSA